MKINIKNETVDADDTFGYFNAWLRIRGLRDEFLSEETTLDRLSEIIRQYDEET